MKKLLFAFFFFSTLLSSVAQGTVSTHPTLTGTNNSGGITFSVRSTSAVVINGITNQFTTAATTASVWVKMGGAGTPPGAINAANGWSEVVLGAIVTPVNGSPVNIPFGAATIQLPANTNMGIHIQANNTNYRTGLAADQTIFTDGTLTIDVSDSVAYGGNPTPTFNPRRFLGSVSYITGINGSCPNVFSNFMIDSIRVDSARVSWTAGDPTYTYKLEHGLAGFIQGTGTSFTASYFGGPPSVFLTGLIPDTDYDVYLTEYCGSTDSSYFPGPQVFTTAPVCTAPTNLTILALDSNSVTFTYTASTDSINWEWGPIGFIQGTGTTGSSQNDTVTITGLSSNTAYDLVIISDCSDRGDGFSRSGQLSFTTDCGFASARFVENFDGSVFPCLNAFIDVTVGVPSVTITTAFNPSSAPQQLTLNNSSATGSNQDVILFFQPFYGLNALNKMVAFNAKTSSTLVTTLDVVSFPDPDNPAVYNVISTVNLSSADQQFMINLDAASNYNGTDPVIGLRHGAQNTFQAIYVDDFIFDFIPTCPSINPFTVQTSAGGGVVAINWVSSISAVGSSLSWGLPGFSPGAGLGSLTTTDTFASVSGLTANTVYEFYLRDSCSASDLSVWTGPFSVLAGCGVLSPVSLPWNEGFELFSTGPIFNGTTNLCSPNYSWRFDASDEINSRLRLQAGAAYYKNGLQAATLDHNPSVSSVQTNFLTLTVNLSAYTSSGGIELGFYVMSHAQEANPNNRVWVRGAPGDNWIEVVNLDLIRTGSAVYDSVQNLNIKAFIDGAGQTVGAASQIRFGQSGRFSSFSTSFSDGFTFDDISLDAVTCPEPAAIISTNLFDTTATLSWAGSSTQYQYWFGPGGFYQGTTTLGGTKAFTNTNSVLIDTLNPQTCYQFLVRSICTSGDSSSWAGPYTFCTPCSPINAPYLQNWDALPTGKDLGCFSPIEDPTFNTSAFAGALITQFGSPFTTGRQVELDNSNSLLPLMIVSPPTTDMIIGDKRLVIRARQSFAATPATQMMVGSISNPNDPSTFHPLDTFDLTDANPHDKYITDLTTANGYNGTDQYFAIAHGLNATFRTMYVDDVIYEAIPSCPEAANLMVLAVDTMNATVAFSPASGSSGNFQIEYGTGSLGSALHSQILAANDTVNLTGLMANTNYCFWVREICTPGDTSSWSDPMCFKTQCSAINAPYFTNWDNLSFGNDVGCFQKIEDPTLQASTFQGITIQTSTFNQPQSAPNVVEFDNAGNISSPLILISPRTNDLTVGDKRLRFYARSNSVFNLRTLIIGTIDNPVDPGTFHPIDTVTMTIAMTEYIVELNTANGYNGTDNYFAIAHGLNSTFQTIYVDDLNYEQIPTCVRPSGLAATNVTQTTALLAWTNANGNSSASYQIEYGQGAFSDPNNTRSIQSNDSLSLVSLTAGSGYCAWVREICAPGDTSLWFGPLCFSTPCPPSYSAPYFTNFEGITIGVASGTPGGWENCWTHSATGSVRWESEDASGANENSSATGPFYDNSFFPASGGTYMYLETSSSGGPAELVSPGIDIATVTNPELEYYYHMFGATINKLVIYAENAAGTRFPLDSIFGAQQAAQADPFLRRNVSLASLPLAVYNIVFEGHRGTSFTGDISIDDVRVQQGSSCPAPLGITANGLSTTSAIARWAGATQAMSYVVEYGATGFTLGSGTSMVSMVDSLVLNFPVANNLCQDVYVRAICAAGDSSTWIGPVAVCPDEVTCDSLDQYNVSLEVYDQSALFVPWAGNAGDVELSTTQSSSAPNSVRIHDQGTNAYSDLVALFDTLTSGAWEIAFDMYIPTGKGAYFNIQQNYIGGAAGNLWGGEVYFLDNGTADAVYTTGSTLAGNFTYTQNQWFTMQTVIDLDNDSVWFEINGVSTNIGYKLSNANAGGPLQFNGVNFFSGVRQGFTYDVDYYFDDFCINSRFINNTCPDPSGLVSTANIGCDSIELDWTSLSGSSLLEYGVAGFTPGTGTMVNVASSPYTVTGLSPGSAYDFRVADICGTDTSSFISGSETTATGPLPVASFTFVESTVGGQIFVYLDASASTNATSYSWDFGNGSTGSGMLDTAIYGAGANFIITLTVTNGCGTATDTALVIPFSIHENALSNSLKVYPNPAKDRVQIAFDEVGSADVQISLRDGQGRNVLHLEDRLEGSTYTHTIDVSDLARGMYMLEVRSGGLISNRRISIQ